MATVITASTGAYKQNVIVMRTRLNKQNKAAAHAHLLTPTAFGRLNHLPI